ATPPGTPLAVALRATGSTVVLDISPLGAEAAPAPPAAASATPPATGAPLQPGTSKLPVEVARLLVERHGGRLEQSDAAGRRGSFRLSLPLAVLNEEPDTCAS